MVLGLAGATLVSSGGAFISTRLDLAPSKTAAIVVFAVGLMCFARMADDGVASRVAKLEQRLQQVSASHRGESAS